MVALSSIIVVFPVFVVLTQALSLRSPLYIRDEPQQCGDLTIQQLNAMPALLQELWVNASPTWGPKWNNYSIVDSFPPKACYPSSMEFTPDLNMICSTSSVTIKGNVVVQSNSSKVGYIAPSVGNILTTVENSTKLLNSTHFNAHISPTGKSTRVGTLIVLLNNTQGSNALSKIDYGPGWEYYPVDNCALSEGAEVDIEWTTCTVEGNIDIRMTLQGGVAFTYGSEPPMQETQFVPLPTPISREAKSELTLSLALSGNMTWYGNVLGSKCKPT